MRPRRLRPIRHTVKPRRRVDKLADWLQRSSYTKLIVSAGATLTFTFGLAFSVWTAYKEYMESTAAPFLSIRMEQVHPTTHWVTMAQMAGLQGSVNVPGFSQLGTNASTFAVAFELRNPTSRRVSISDCLLEVQRTKGAETVASQANLSLNAVKRQQVEPPFVLAAEPGSTAFAERVFAFTKVKFEAAKDFSESSERQSNLTCFDEKRKAIQTGWPRPHEIK
jgi:hypothetical protein